MKMKLVPAVTLTVVCLALPFTSLAQSATDQPDASKMVPAQVALKTTLDAKKLQPGATFNATLASKVHLANGPELPAGTVLVGQITDDDMQVAGTSKLAVRFTGAQLKNGQIVPIKATIVNVVNADDVVYDGTTPAPVQASDNWTVSQKVDQLNVRAGLDMHSMVASSNSGVFVSSKGKDLQVKAGSQFSIGIATSPSPAGGATGAVGH